MTAADFPARHPAVAQGDNTDVSDKEKFPLVVSQQEDEGEAHKVHEITESSSDESVDETLSRSRSRKTTRAIEKGLDVEAAVTVEEKVPEVEKTHAKMQMSESEEVYNTKNVADMHYLFTNDKLKVESPAIVLKSDPFCIPRVTDNVPNYQPMLNPLSIFLGEDQLLPGNFRLDPSERPPNADGKAVTKQDEKTGSHGRLPPPPGRPSSTASTGTQFRGKTSAFMGTMPRQTEFAEIPVSEKLFQSHRVFRPLPPISRIPKSPSRDGRLASMNSNSSSRPFTSGSSEGEEASPSCTADRGATLASLSDAMLLSSIQHTLDVATVAPTAVSPLDSAAELATSSFERGSMYQIQQLQPLDSIADTLTNYLPNRSVSMPNSSRPVSGQHFNPLEVINSANTSMSYTTGAPDTFGRLLSPAEHRANTSYAGLFVESTNQTMQIFSSALDSISITTPTHDAAGINAGFITPQGRASGGTTRRPGAKKPRAKNVFRPCTFAGCTKGARGKSGLCQKHGGGKRCAKPDCPKGAQGSSAMCLFHGGGYRCTVEGCSTGARGTSGLCAKHGGYKKGKAVSTGKREVTVNGAVAKRIRTNVSQQIPAAVDAE